MRVGLLTGGGDCPGLNAVIRAVVQRVHNAGGSCVGILEGWRGLVRGQHRELPISETEGIIARGGTILGASRTNPFKDAESDLPRLLDNYRGLALDALIAIGGDDTLAVASRLHADHDLAVVGVPKTIDNDMDVTDVTFGFDTAINIVIEAIDRLRTTSESHRRVMVVETMGRQTGWIACYSGIAAAADYILIPEVPIDLDDCVAVLKRRRDEGKPYGIVVASEGARFPDLPSQRPVELGRAQLGGIAAVVAQQIERATGIETRSVVLGHIQRGGAPSAFDRILATRFGLAAADLVLRRKFGRLVALRGAELVEAPLGEAVTRLKRLDLNLYREASAFFQ
jgi:phosphofructokinase-like protein